VINLKNIKEHKKIFILIIIIISTLISFNLIVKNDPDIINYKKIVYKRNKICDEQEKISEDALNYNLYQILGTTEYSEKNFILNNFDVEELILKSYKNRPAKEGNAIISINECKENKKRQIKGRYKIIKNNLIIILEEEIFIYYYDKKSNKLIDFNSYNKENNNIKYSLEK